MSGVGKSVTARALAARRGLDWFPEPGAYIDPAAGERLPPFPGADNAVAARASRVWPTVELRRRDHRLLAAAARPKQQVVDCTPVSVLSFEMGKAHFGFTHATDQLAAEYLSLACKGLLEEPSLWVFLTAPTEVVLERIHQRGGSRPFLKRAATVEYMCRVLTVFMEEFVPRSRCLLIDNSETPVSDVVERVTARVDGALARRPKRAMRDFFRAASKDASFLDCGHE